MPKPRFSLATADDELQGLINQASHHTLAIWARDCALRVLPLFEAQFPNDVRPRQALATLQDWIDTGRFSMSVIRAASLNAHAAAREVGEDNPARSAARAAGQAVATAHVRTHSPGAAKYAQQALFRAALPGDAQLAATQEREWQFNRLKQLIKERQP
ncbi:MAG: hypothetical protein H0S82_00940 [Anaerolineaceae bacterium]|nr:hypothetical protein [Anaerolineaceae bacterium]